MPINLTGMNTHNKINLTGKEDTKPNANFKIQSLKKCILSNYIVPLYSEQWGVINHNKFLIDEMIGRVNSYLKIYKLDELVIFLELLKVLKMLIDKNDLLTDITARTNAKLDKNNIINMVYKTTKIRIMPEYELYNSIIGKPAKGEPYRDEIINDIKILLKRENINYDKISEFINKKYNSC